MHNRAQTRSFDEGKPMLASQRKQQILQILTEEKQVMSGELSQRFNVSEDSIRRDLRELAAEGKLQRVHGGALPVSAAIAPIETRKSVQIASKQAVARAADARAKATAMLDSLSGSLADLKAGLKA